VALSLFSVSVQVPGEPVSVAKNVLAADTSGQTAMQIAVAAAIAAAGEGAVLQNASEVGGRPIDLSVSTGTATDPKVVYSVQFRPGSGPNGSTPNPVMVYVNPAAATSPETLALTTAAQTGATPTFVTLMGNVDIDATGAQAAVNVTLSKFAFRSLFTLAEQIAIDNHASNTALTADQQATVTTLLVNFSIADTITLTDPMTVMGVNYIASLGLITSDRAAAILADQPAPTS